MLTVLCLVLLAVHISRTARRLGRSSTGPLLGSLAAFLAVVVGENLVFSGAHSVDEAVGLFVIGAFVQVVGAAVIGFAAAAWMASSQTDPAGP